ncbi:zinc finger CCCH domain-containing protein 19-like [Populus alba x Populus x berolinensis]|uniref:Zinc finger CCCH domain-containing protein 19-like n=1 Tax=Populus alba x Populus x berolinensis TaxID=444605 RepID=A0AAD6R350_9ROSI|nr:zinc finger CCCH domain-containing protein 19-like [Populus alba x Populus x berolinensis]
METEEEENSINPSRSSIELENESNLTTTITTTTTTTTDTESVAELNESNASQLRITDTDLLQQQSQPPQSQTQTTVVDMSDAQDFVVGDSGSVSPQHLVIEGREGEEVAEATEGSGEIEAPREVAEKEVENRDLAAKEERNEDVSGYANAGNNEMETETEGVAGVAAELETETSSQEVETMEEEVAEVKEELAEAENTENMENADVVEEKKEGADVVDKVEMDSVVNETKTVRVNEEEEERVENTEIYGVGDEMEAVEQREITDVVEEGKVEKTEVVADVARETEDVERVGMTEIVEEEKAEKIEVNDEKQSALQVEMTDIAEEMGEDEKNEMTDIAEEIMVAGQLETTDVAGGTEQAINEEGEAMETKMIDVAEEGDKEEDTEMEMAEKGNEGDDMADEAEGVGDGVEEVGRSGGGKRKRGKNAKTPSRATSKKKMEEDVCFICFDGGELVLCDRRGCSKAYHPSCVNRDEAFFRAKGRWNCGWHLCSNCVKNAYYMCYTCTFSLCKGCIKDAVILCVRGNKGFCETCMKTIMLIERNEQGSKETVQVDFDDKSSWEYLFKDYWNDLKERLSLTPEELAQAKNPWKGSDSHTGKQELADELYDVHNDGGSGSDSSADAEVTTSRRRKPKKRLRSRAKEKDSPGSVSWAEGESEDESVEWASKELLEFVMHMKNGDKSACSQFDVQALLLDYIKRNKLRDPRRKSQIICDSRLENLFGKPRVGHFEMLKLLESHFLLKDDSQADDLQGSVVDTESSQLEADGNSDALMKASKDKRRKSRKKGEGRGLQSNIDDYAAINMHNINLIYLRRSLLEDLIEDTEAFHDKAVGSFVRIRISGNAQKQDLYRLVQVIGTSKAAEPYRVGKKMTSFMLEILNLNKTELVSIDIISNQEFTEDECKRLRQSIKCGLINRLTVGDIQEKAIAIQAVRVQDSLESEITRLSHLRDRASDMGHRKEYPLLVKFYWQFYHFYIFLFFAVINILCPVLHSEHIMEVKGDCVSSIHMIVTSRECVEKLQLLKTPEERQRRLEEIPEIHADPNMDPSHESDEDEGETEDKRQENSLRPRGSGFSRKGREPISPRKGGFTSNDTWGGSKSYSSTNRELSRNLSDKGFSSKGDDIGGGESVNENFWGQGREKQTQQSQSTNSTVISESVPGIALEISPSTPSTVVTQSAAKVNEAEKIWYYQDPSGKIQGPFSMVQLRKWSNTGYFPVDLRIWRNTGTKDDSILLTEALSGNFQRDPPAVDNSFLKTQLVQSPHLPSSFTGNIAQAAPVPVEVPKYSTDRWDSGTNLPSPTPGQTTPSLTKGKVFESQWSPTPAQPVGSALGANQSSVGNVELQGATVISGTPSKMSHGVSPLPKLEPGMLSISSNGSQMHSQSTLPVESPKVQVNSHMHSVLDPSGTSVNATVDMRSLQNLVQPGTSGNSLVGTHGWGAGSIPRPEMYASHAITGAGSQAWGSTQLQKPEANNLVSMPSQPSAYSNWGNAQTSVRNPSSSLTTGNPSGVSPVPSTGTNPWRAPVPGPSNIQPSVPSSGPWGMGITDNQGATPRQGPENQNTSWGPIPGNQNMGWGVSLPPNSNQGWAVPGQVPSAGNVNPGWGAPVQGQAPGNANPAWGGAPVQGQAPGNAFSGWGPSGQGPAPTNANTGWVPPSQGPPPPPPNANTNWPVPTGNAGTWGSDANQNGDRDRFSSQRDRGSHGGDSGYGGGKQWNRQSSFNRSRDSPRPPFKGQRICKYHEHGHCKKGASCDYMHN